VNALVKKKMKKMHRMIVGGAVAVKSTDLLRHARDPHALTGDISGLTQVGIGGALSGAVMDIALGTGKKKKKKR